MDYSKLFSGHSRTIVGIEQFGKSKTRLLVLDPSHKQGAMRMLLDESQLQPPVLKKIRIPLSRLDSKQYQIVCIDDGFVTDDREYLVSILIYPTLWYTFLIVDVLILNFRTADCFSPYAFQSKLIRRRLMLF